MSLLLGVNLKQFNISGLDFYRIYSRLRACRAIFICNRWVKWRTVKAGWGFDANVEKSDFKQRCDFAGAPAHCTSDR